MSSMSCRWMMLLQVAMLQRFSERPLRDWQANVNIETNTCTVAAGLSARTRCLHENIWQYCNDWNAIVTHCGEFTALTSTSSCMCVSVCLRICQYVCMSVCVWVSWRMLVRAGLSRLTRSCVYRLCVSIRYCTNSCFLTAALPAQLTSGNHLSIKLVILRCGQPVPFISVKLGIEELTIDMCTLVAVFRLLVTYC